jgi:hypothetical protein
MTVFLSLYSCVHDELISSSDPASKEYHSKSLWKEDEIYIVNVKKIYEENEDEIRKEHGTPLWEYAMTMDKFDESYLLVPVKKNGEVSEVLEVPRFGKKIYFKYTNEEERLSFFRKLFIDTPKKALPTSLSNEASKLICVTRTVSIWYPDSESNPNGSGHWGSSSYATCYNLDIESFENPDDGSSGGGYDYPPFGGGGPDNPLDTITIPKNPCEKTKSIVNKPQIKDSLTSLKSHANTNTKIEAGFQELKSGTLANGTVSADNQIFFGIGSNSVGTVHTHQPKTIGIFAPKDIMTFLDIVREQDANSLGNAYSGTVSSIGTYFINFTGTASDLPPEMPDAQEEAYVAKLVEIYKSWEDFLSQDDKYSTNNLKVNKPQGLEILLFKLLKQMNLDDKIQLIKEDGGNTSTIKENPDGTTTPNPC